MSSTDKASLRRRLRAARAALSAEHRAAANAAALAHLRASPWWPTEGQVALFAAFGDEIDPRGLDDGRAAYPRVDGDALVFHACAFGALTPQPPWQIPEPTAEMPVADDVRLYVVPGLGFTRAGDRIGYGRGFYDRALLGSGVPAVGLGFEAQIVDALPVAPHDVRLDAVVTEAGVWRAPDS